MYQALFNYSIRKMSIEHIALKLSRKVVQNEVHIVHNVFSEKKKFFFKKITSVN